MLTLVLIALLVPPPIACGDPPAAPKQAPAGIFVAVGYGGRRMSSRDGIHWEHVQQWSNIAGDDSKTIDHFAAHVPPVRSMAFGGGTFLLVSTDGIYTTKDGKAWHKEPAVPADKFRQAVYTGREFFLSGEKGTYTSADGASWKAFGKAIPCGVSWSNGSLFIGTTWPGRFWTSPDGLKWARGEAPQPELGIDRVVYGEVTAKE